MKRLSGIGLTLTAVFLLLPTPAHAAWEYYTYGGFDSVLPAWQRVALIFSDSNYNSLFFPIVVLGMFCAIVVLYLKLLGGANVGGPMSWAVPVGIGIILYLGLVVPKDSLMIYDPVMNEGPVEVSGIPLGIAAMAGSLNEIQNGLIDIIDTSSDPVELYQQNAGGEGFNILLQTGQESLQIPPELEGSIQQYTKDCLLFELTRPGTTLTPSELASSTDFRTDYAKAASPAIYTVSYISNSVGDTMTCQDAWTAINSAVSSPTTWTNDINNICAQSGYDPTIPAELQKCKDLAADTSEWIWGANYPLQNLAMQSAFTQAIEETFNNASPDQAIQTLAARQTGSDWLSAGLAGNTWIPVIMAAMTTLAITILPFLIMFLPTPLFGKVISLIAGIFIWLTAWGVIDAIIHSFGVDYARHAAQQLQEFNLGVKSISYFPTFGMKTLAAFGNMRWFGLMLATVITGMLVRFGGSALAHLAGGLTAGAAAGGSAAGRMEMDPQAKGGKVEGEAKGFGLQESIGGSNMEMRQIFDSYRNRSLKGLSEGAALGGPGASMRAGEAQGAAERGTGELYGRFEDQFGEGYDGAPELLQDARAENWAAGRPGALKPLQNLDALGANAVPTLIAAGAVGVGRQVADEQALAEVAKSQGKSVMGLERDLAEGKLESTVGAINTYGRLTGASSFDQAAAGYFATMGRVAGAGTTGSAAGLEKIGPEGLAFKTEREMENEYAKFRMLDAAAKAQGLSPMQFLAAHHGAGISFADSKANGVDTFTMSADGKPLMSTSRMNLDAARLKTFAKELDKPGTTYVGRALLATSEKGEGAAITMNADSAGNIVSMSAESGGKALLNDYSIGQTGYANAYNALTSVNKGLQEKSGTFVQKGTDIENKEVDKTIISHGTVFDDTAFQMALKEDRALVHQVTNPYLSDRAKDAEIAAMVAPLAKAAGQFAKRSGVSMDYTKGDAQLSVGAGGGLIFKANMGASGTVGGQRQDEKNINLIAQQYEAIIRSDLAKAKEKGFNWQESENLLSRDLSGYARAFQKEVEANSSDKFGASSVGAALKSAEGKIESANIPTKPIITDNERGEADSE
ncbi:MAG: conjugal transfer protein TraG N-terminal domain-containing protein [Nitrospiraceae bacterium]|nr:conjugal transfer protein TraG N-terminal domain-containing protein [Nitrospiraceae bacterium]